MKDLDIQIIPMQRRHLAACDALVASSEPWRTLREDVDFSAAIRKHQAYAALIAGAVAGFVVFTPEPVFARGGYLRAIAVAPAIRGFGIGRRLLAFAERTTAKKAPNIYLCVSSFNREAQRFYRSCGYRRVGEVDGLVRKGLTEQIYWKRLQRQGAA
jgi:ribosomal-protein-alanine N-acetyltransferase